MALPSTASRSRGSVSRLPRVKGFLIVEFIRPQEEARISKWLTWMGLPLRASRVADKEFRTTILPGPPRSAAGSPSLSRKSQARSNLRAPFLQACALSWGGDRKQREAASKPCLGVAESHTD